ncbi:MAG TPA: hypothetical protein VHF65_06850 [Nitrososphaera sp.]|nr:hypothetical protein [Nitrososphaera sp.]
MMTTVKKQRQAYTTAARLPLLLLIASMLTVPVMLFSAPLAAADVVSDCKDSGGTYVVNAAGQGHCFVTIEPDCHKLPPGEVVPDPELCIKSGGIANDPIFDINDISAEVEDIVDEFTPVVVDGDQIAESVQDTLDGIGVRISDGDN